MLRAWEAEQPGSPLPWAGEADALVGEAERMHAVGNMPFTARADAQLAPARYTTGGLVHDSAFVVGEATPKVRWAGCLAPSAVEAGLAVGHLVVSGVFLLLGVLTGVPLARTVGIAVLAMVGTSLFSSRPFDGAYGRSRRAEGLSGLALPLVGVAITLGLV